jgi:hypothetical protein
MSGFFIFNYKNKTSANHSSVVDYNIGKKRMRVGSNINLGKEKRAFVMVEEKKILKIGYVGLVGDKTPGEQPWFTEGGKEWNNVYQIEECSELVVLEQLCSELEIDKKIFTKSLQFGHVRAEFKGDFERAVTYFQGRMRPDPEQKYEEQDQPPAYESEQPGEDIHVPAPPVLRREIPSDYPAPQYDQVEGVFNRFVFRLTDGLVKNLAKEMVDEQEKREREKQRQMEREAKEREEKQRQIDREEKQREAKEEFKCKVDYCYACKLEHISAATPSYEGAVCDYEVCKRVVNARHERIADVEAAYQFKKYHNVAIEQHQKEVLSVISSRQKPKDKFPYPIIKNPFLWYNTARDTDHWQKRND